MTYRVNGALIASLSGVALMLAANETFAGSGVAPRAGVTSTRSIPGARVAPSFRHHHGIHTGAFWPAIGDSSYGPPNDEPPVGATQPFGDVHYTYTYDVPWDWVHRYPPAVTPSERPYVPSCPAETVTVPARNGKEQTVNIVRCY
jgi:hypothetical protein